MKCLNKHIVLLVTLLVFSFPLKTSAFDIVYDPTVWLQSFITWIVEVKQHVEESVIAGENTAQTLMQVEQLLNELEMAANQIKQLENEAAMIGNQIEALNRYHLMLENWALQLEKLESGDFWGFLESIAFDLDENWALLGETRSIMKEPDIATEAYEDTFDTFGGELPLPPEELIVKKKEWNTQLNNSGYDAAVMMKLLSNSEVDMVRLSEAMQAIQNANGDVGVLQGIAELQAIQIKQNREKMQLGVADMQLETIQTGISASKEDQERKEGERFVAEQTEWEEVPASMPPSLH